jgi:hypothetical protein
VIPDILPIIREAGLPDRRQHHFPWHKSLPAVLFVVETLARRYPSSLLQRHCRREECVCLKPLNPIVDA